MNKFLSTIVCSFICLMSFAQMENPAKWNYRLVENADGAHIEFKVNIDPGWHMYDLNLPEGGPVSTTFHFEKLQGCSLAGEIQSLQKAKSYHDAIFNMMLRTYEKQASFVQAITIENRELLHIEGYVQYMLCDDQACLPPNSLEFSIGNLQEEAAPAAISGLDALSQHPELWTPVIGELQAFGGSNNINSSNTAAWLIFIYGFVGGLLALFTPCVWPIIPMTVSFFLKRNRDRRKAIKDAISYGISIVVIYLVVGLSITLIFGASALNSLATNAVFNLIFFLLLVAFALSFFGLFELVLPSSWSNKMDGMADKTSGLLSIFFMAFTLVLVSFSCTGPIIGTLLVEASTQGGLLGPTLGMSGFALALALPFTLFAIFPNIMQSMPRSGGWLQTFKVVLGFLELALSLKFLSVADMAYSWGILPREVFIILWIIIAISLGLYLLNVIRFPHDEKVDKLSWIRISGSIVSFLFAAYMIPGVLGAPTKAISAFTPPMSTQHIHVFSSHVEPDFYSYEEGMLAAQAQNKKVLIDFSGYGCVNCRKMENAVWTDTRVKAKLEKDFVLISLMVDDKTALENMVSIEENGQTRKLRSIGDKWSYLQRYKFGANAQPFYLILTPEGRPLTHAYAFNDDPKDFLDYLNSVE